jgi:hypothetical protein
MAIANDFWADQLSPPAEFGGLGMSFNICGGKLGSLAMFTAISGGKRRGIGRSGSRAN